MATSTTVTLQRYLMAFVALVFVCSTIVLLSLTSSDVKNRQEVKVIYSAIPPLESSDGIPTRAGRLTFSGNGPEEINGKPTTPTYCSTRIFASSFARAAEYMDRFFDATVASVEQQHFHSPAHYLNLANSEFADGMSMCDWDDCLDTCVDASIKYSLLMIKDGRASTAIAILQHAIDIKIRKQELSKLMTMQGFAYEYVGQLQSLGEDLYQKAIDTWPPIRDEYLGVLRPKLAADASKEEKMRIYIYGKQEQLEALVNLLLLKEFQPKVISIASLKKGSLSIRQYPSSLSLSFSLSLSLSLSLSPLSLLSLSPLSPLSSLSLSLSLFSSISVSLDIYILHLRNS